MVFGTTYCPISHLPIQDGDVCVLIPLGFRMQHEFDKWNKADINCFAYLYNFIKPTEEVKFNGNIADLTYPENTYSSGKWHGMDMKKELRHKKGEKYDEYELFMLIHKGFYKKIIAQEGISNDKTLDNLSLFNTVRTIWEEMKEEATREKYSRMIQLAQKEITQKEYDKLEKEGTQTPEWVANIYKVAWFMGRMGIAPHPVFANDQRDMGELYEKFRNEFVKKPKL